MYRKIILISSIIILCLTGCKNTVLPTDSKGTQALKRGEEGFDYAEEVNMDKDLLKGVSDEISEYVDVKSISDFKNDSTVAADEETQDFRFATITAKDGKEYTTCFDGYKGTLYGIVDKETGYDLVTGENNAEK